MQYFGILDRNYRKLIENFDRGKAAEKGLKGIAESNNMKGDQIFNEDSSYKEVQSKFGRRSSVGSVSGNSVDNIGAAPSHLVHPRLKASKPIYTSMVQKLEKKNRQLQNMTPEIDLLSKAQLKYQNQLS